MSRDALVVGINKYPFLKDSATGNYKHLTTPATDAEAIAQLLETHGNFRVKRFPASNIDGKLQVDPDKLVKTEELEAAILDLFLPESGKPPETALLFFAGHGLRKQLRQSLTQGFLATSDTSPSKNLWGLSLRELWEILQQSQAQQQVIWLDCCFSGELLNFKDTEMGRHSSGCDRFLIAASPDYEVAYQQLDGKHGVLTGALLAGLNPHLVPEFEWITNRTLTVSVEQKLQAYYKGTKIPQSPLISNHGEAIKLIQGRAKPLSQNQSDANNFQNFRLEPHTINELVKLLRPFLEDERNRRPFLVLALGNDEPVLQHISWGGAVAIFIPDMVCKLADYGEVAPGKQALWALLEYVRSQVGIDIQQRIDNLRPLLEVRSRSDSEGVSPSFNAADTTSIDVLVQKVRDRLHDDIQRLHGTMPLLGVDHWVDLGELFVDVNILEEVTSSRKLELDDLWQDFNTNVQEYSSHRSLDRIGLGKQQQRVSGLKVLEKNTNFMVLGKPGSGKTTYLQRIVTECNGGRLQAQRIPVLIKLREFVDDGRRFKYDLKSYLIQQWRISDTETELILTQGKVLILLDGLDEVAGAEEQEISKQIKRFARTYPQNQLILTCRTQSQESRFERFDYVEVADFNENQVSAFAAQYYKTVSSDIEKGQTKTIQFIQELYLEKNKSIRELAITPILLNLTCAVFHQTGKFYSKRSKLYEEGLELFLVKWDQSREVERDEIYRDLSVKRKQELLSYLAIKKLKQEQYVLFEQEEIEEYIAEFLNISRSDGQAVLKSIEAQHGLLIERAQKVWSFSHLTFQEYLAASAIKEQNNIHELLNHLTEKRWREVFVLTAQMLPMANALLQLMKIQIDDLIAKENKLQQSLWWLNQKTSSSLTPYKASVIRAFYFTLAHASGYAIDRTIPKKLASNLFFDFELTRAFVSEDGLDIDFNLARIIDSDFASVIGVTHSHGHHWYGDLDIYRTHAINQALECVSFSKVVNALKETPSQEIAFKFAFALAWGFALPPYFYKSLRKLRDELQQVENLKEPERGESIQIDDMNILVQISPTLSPSELKQKRWWKENLNTWTHKLKSLVNGYCNIGHDWKFNQEEKELLNKYYKANELLVDCLNNSCNVSQKVKEEIKETLLLPIAEIEKRKREKNLSDDYPN